MIYPAFLFNVLLSGLILSRMALYKIDIADASEQYLELDLLYYYLEAHSRIH